jgi:hypothetical protein
MTPHGGRNVSRHAWANNWVAFSYLIENNQVKQAWVRNLHNGQEALQEIPPGVNASPLRVEIANLGPAGQTVVAPGRDADATSVSASASARAQHDQPLVTGLTLPVEEAGIPDRRVKVGPHQLPVPREGEWDEVKKVTVTVYGRSPDGLNRVVLTGPADRDGMRREVTHDVALRDELIIELHARASHPHTDTVGTVLHDVRTVSDGARPAVELGFGKLINMNKEWAGAPTAVRYRIAGDKVTHVSLRNLRNGEEFYERDITARGIDATELKKLIESREIYDYTIVDRKRN